MSIDHNHQWTPAITDDWQCTYQFARGVTLRTCTRAAVVWCKQGLKNNINWCGAGRCKQHKDKTSAKQA